MKRTVFMLVICLFLGAPNFAQQNSSDSPASKEDIERYLEVMHTRENFRLTMDLVSKQLHQMVHDQVKKETNLPPDFEARADRKTDDMLKNFPIDDLLQVIIPVYQKHFTKGDIDQLIAFYSTPTGQRLIKEQPAIGAEVLQASSGIVQKLTAKAMQTVQEEIAQVRKDGNGSPKKESPQN